MSEIMCEAYAEERYSVLLDLDFASDSDQITSDELSDLTQRYDYLLLNKHLLVDNLKSYLDKFGSLISDFHRNSESELVRCSDSESEEAKEGTE
ncbi:hypothetical protein Q7M76_04830 [Candidatus Liberibacter asiaticus]|uniref:Uncharacterized protein n=2 Tax=Liberibacter asiaticus TaxID=34021 RepID=C6XGQ1_LIBAP|nr:hypothetical protein [Candidatus Liberibacter asiaticus]QHZ60138.1 hypothetical protein pCLasA4_gp02 [Liberibacter phage pCLasA4]QHZ60146.1 hypothetical protein pCLasGDCZ2_gp02 [Liberibacter phage pCLasGDCZ2]QHZ60154.1 hypothetical protein pCLasGDDQ6_gp02 [Liberibacter phage pCLasGDDQ6]QHZ60162.1 hypothetical protein pCLasGDDQ7_gp02 [Liberibacter phage pCLasGDDQ7]QHZ60170.1 hypothetical protein pCLasGDQY1_gp02 [Liberibacter phage pCLasGDQY1]QHZ60178.1 hypothetical protein pCLasGDXH1_gp02 [